MQVVLLGSAPDPNIQSDFVNLANQLHSLHHDRVRLCLVYDEPLSHLVIHCRTKIFVNAKNTSIIISYTFFLNIL